MVKLIGRDYVPFLISVISIWAIPTPATTDIRVTSHIYVVWRDISHRICSSATFTVSHKNNLINLLPTYFVHKHIFIFCAYTQKYMQEDSTIFRLVTPEIAYDRDELQVHAFNKRL